MIDMSSRTNTYSFATPAAVVWRLALFGCLWLFLSGGNMASWPFGLGTTLLATWLHMRLSARQTRRLRLAAIIRFVPYFIGLSFLSGVDVMRRVLHPRLPIDPALVDYPFIISHKGGRILLANCVSLLPGTISAQFQPDTLLIHSLDKRLPVVETVRDLERRIAALYSEPPAATGDGQ